MKKDKILQKNEEGILEEIEVGSWYCTQGFKDPKDWDWKLIRKEWKALKMPKDLAYDIFHIPWGTCAYNMLISKRGVGKTTSILLLGLILFKLYGVIIQYIRSTEDMTAPKFAQELMSTILACGYIEKLTDGRWNYAYYHAKKWVFANIDEQGKIVERTNNHFLYVISLDKNLELKSNYNAPHGDLTVFDEFIGKYTPNEFIRYLDVLSTIIRKRAGVINVMLSNAIDEYSEYFDEFEINEEIRQMKKGDCRICESSGGTKIYVELIDHHDKNAARLNKEYFGFKNPRLYAITGAGEWNVPICKHYDLEDEPEVLDKTHYVKMGLNLINLELCYSEKYGHHVRAHKATKLYKDSIVYTMDLIDDKRFRKCKGWSKLDRFIWELLKRDMWHYATNSVKNFVEKYSIVARI